MPVFEPSDFVDAPLPSGDMRRFVYQDGTLFLEADLAPGAKGDEPHSHTWPTMFFCTGGRGRIQLDTEWHDVGPGSVVSVPANVLHWLDVQETLSLVEIQVECPSWFVDQLVAGVPPGTPPPADALA